MKQTSTPSAPVAIGGIGGSGTRLIAWILTALDYDLGPDLNEALDCQLFSLFFKRQELWPIEKNTAEIARCWHTFRKALRHPDSWTEAELQHVQALAGSPRPRLPVDWLQWRVKLFRDLRPGRTSERWGWKEPNTHVFLQELAQLEPQLKYIHVVRHGLDMAFSDNQEQLLYWGPGYLGSNISSGPADSFRFWCRANRQALACQESMGNRFLLLNFDWFCLSPREGLEQLLDFLSLQISPELETKIIDQVQVPASINRHRQHEIDFVTEDELALLQSLGYAFSRG